MKRADWVRPLLEMLEGQARRAGQAGLSSGQKALAAHLFDIIINEVSCIPELSDPGAGVQACCMQKACLSTLEKLHGPQQQSLLHTCSRTVHGSTSPGQSTWP